MSRQSDYFFRNAGGYCKWKRYEIGLRFVRGLFVLAFILAWMAVGLYEFYSGVLR